ncbi:hypothetical protein GTZ99_09630 [Novosphingobium sp. FSY-8]|uniref:Uncharacterized protein n=1 Tax=Novosphingobium ovatum TaxID=1908523 RepID=A0ABW9XE41_9SPHN|nr:hypothetical protein [Novosphingobium ovatum]NBC36816.1 hypothetical protein [Novosphingobium ovatum]
MRLRLGPVSALAVVTALICAAPAHADTLIDHVNGVTYDLSGNAMRFTGVVVSDQGRIVQVLRAGDPRPARPDYILDAKGATMLPGLISPPMRLIPAGLRLLLPAAAQDSAVSVGGVAVPAPMPNPRPEDRDTALGTIQPALLARGITTVVDMGTTIEDWQTYRRAGDAGRLRLRVVSYADGLANMILIGGPGPTPWLYQDRLYMGGLWVGARVMPPPVARPVAKPVRGVARVAPVPALPAGAISDVQLKNMMSRAAMDHFQPAVLAAEPGAQAIADAAIVELAQTYQGDRRWRVEPAPPVETLPDGVNAATLPTRTAQAAHAAMAEARLGRIAPGLMADFLLAEGDPFQPGASLRLLSTWIGGVRVWQAAERAP